ncbi:MAG: hypothetical protein HRU37_07225, partial [Roseibacillus sp.]|nr:hypothetical protein [Roseibacillus sp.]
QVGKEVRRRQAQGDRKGTSYLGREHKAAAEKPYFIEILSGEFPEVPEGFGDDGEDGDDNS